MARFYSLRREDEPSVFAHLDWWTVIIYLIMVIGGALSIYAASYDFDNASVFSWDEFSGKQMVWIGCALFIGLILLLINARVYETYAYPIYVLIVILLAVTIVIAPDIKGSRSWLVLGPMSIQPAEFAKFATALALAKLFNKYQFTLNAKMSNYVRALAIIFIPIVLILAQNETGSALTFIALFFVLYREGMSGLILFAALLAVVIFVVAVKYTETNLLGMTTGQCTVFIITQLVMIIMVFTYGKHFQVGRNVFFWFLGTDLVMWIIDMVGIVYPGLPIMIGVMLMAAGYITFMAFRSHMKKLLAPAAAAVFAIAFLFCVDFAFGKLQPHQQLRIKVVLSIEQDLRGAGYNVNQSKIAIGSGGFWGKGFLNGTQTKLKYVPEQHTDFIFCTIGEEEGFMGATAVVVLYVLLIWRVFKMAERASSAFGRIYGYCVGSYFIFHFCINIGMVIGLCPVIGIPLPFFSYGGSSLWSFTILLFILLRLDSSRRMRIR